MGTRFSDSLISGQRLRRAQRHSAIRDAAVSVGLFRDGALVQLVLVLAHLAELEVARVGRRRQRVHLLARVAAARRLLVKVEAPLAVRPLVPAARRGDGRHRQPRLHLHVARVRRQRQVLHNVALVLWNYLENYFKIIWNYFK